MIAEGLLAPVVIGRSYGPFAQASGEELSLRADLDHQAGPGGEPLVGEQVRRSTV
ncbi:hypothetical protein ACIBCM_33390 [Streptomyces sp. NPDC051018]|uniref:hypothetical protein n=1 Tax=Streptomyces sp. NPDC051018 TaxID=3365639 RepID=UPI00379E42BC